MSGWSGALTETAKLTASDTARADLFRGSVSISGDTVVVGAPRDDCKAGNDCGSAYIFAGIGLGEHQITGVLDAAGFQALISPGSIVSVFGNFAETTATASSIPLSENLSGFSVTFNDKWGIYLTQVAPRCGMRCDGGLSAELG